MNGGRGRQGPCGHQGNDCINHVALQTAQGAGAGARGSLRAHRPPVTVAGGQASHALSKALLRSQGRRASRSRQHVLEA